MTRAVLMAHRSIAVQLSPLAVTAEQEDPKQMRALPGIVRGLLADEPATREAAWAQFVEEYSRLLLHAARSVSTNHDEAMDGYTGVLEELRRESFRRFRSYAADPRASLTTWLVVVARRICVDVHRARYGRWDGATSEARESAKRSRRQLEDLVSSEADLDGIPNSTETSAEAMLVAAETDAALAAALQRLDPEDQLLLKLRFTDGLSALQVARAIGVSSQFQVYRRIKALLHELRSSLQAMGVDGPAE